MKLHKHPDIFAQLITLTADFKNLSANAIKRDYYIVLLLEQLANSDFADQCVFKGGTSLSKCYPGSIERFSEDIDLTYLGTPDMTDKMYDRNLKKIETAITTGSNTEKINAERNNRNKSIWVWFDEPATRIKLEIGSSVRPDPYSKRKVKTYIQEFLEVHDGDEDIKAFDLEEVELNVLSIERTFIDKLMSVKRHAICGTLRSKVRHIYDVHRLYLLPEIKAFLADTAELKRLIQLTKDTDSFYLTKRNISKEYNPCGLYDFDGWKHYFTEDIRKIYESLHENLLYTNEKQVFDEAVESFKAINEIFNNINE
ncbi:MAG: nucleotidyl transferase AbiEii/AbiGii toxin family protein [Phascolarctobacterium sp.]|nr:nucleotidyl transferase AbiEii/AbiGii toxin family protein [Phascolarctobacterium sp.]